MDMWDSLMQLVMFIELLIVIGSAIFMHAFSTSIKGRIVRPTIPFIILMAVGWMLIPDLPSIDSTNASSKFIIQFVSFSVLLVVSGIAALVILGLLGKKPNTRHTAAWPWR